MRREQQEKEAKEKMEFEMYVDMMEEKGVSQHERLKQNLEDYAKLKSSDHLLQGTFDRIIMDMKAKQMKAIWSHKETQEEIAKNVQRIQSKYPGSKQRRGGRQAKIMMDEIAEDAEEDDADEEEQEAEFEAYQQELQTKINRTMRREAQNELEAVEDRLKILKKSTNIQ